MSSSIGTPFGGPEAEVVRLKVINEALTQQLEEAQEQRNHLDSWFRQMKTEIVEFIFEYGGIDGGHHKQWVLDQLLRKILQEDYPQAIAVYQGEEDEDGEVEYEWDTGIAP